MTGFDSKRKIALDRLDDDDVQVYAQPNLKGKSMTKDEALTLEALKYAASMGHMLRGKFGPFTIKSTLAQPVQEPVAWMNNKDFEPIRVRIMQEAYELADRNDSESYNAIKVMCGDVQRMLPPKRPWVRLTDEEIADFLGEEFHTMTDSEERFFRLGVQAAKEKNL